MRRTDSASVGGQGYDGGKLYKLATVTIFEI